MKHPWDRPARLAPQRARRNRKFPSIADWNSHIGNSGVLFSHRRKQRREPDRKLAGAWNRVHDTARCTWSSLSTFSPSSSLSLSSLTRYLHVLFLCARRLTVALRIGPVPRMRLSWIVGARASTPHHPPPRPSFQCRERTSTPSTPCHC